MRLVQIQIYGKKYKFRDIGREMKEELDKVIAKGIKGKWYKGDLRSGSDPFPNGWSTIDGMGSNTVIFDVPEQLHPKMCIMRNITYVRMTDIEMKKDGEIIDIPNAWVSERDNYPRFGISSYILGIKNGKLDIIHE